MKTMEERKAAVNAKAAAELAELAKKEELQNQLASIDSEIEGHRLQIQKRRLAIKDLQAKRDELKPPRPRTSK